MKIKFLLLEISRKTYTSTNTIAKIEQVKLVEKKEFWIAALGLGEETYMLYLANLAISNLNVQSL